MTPSFPYRARGRGGFFGAKRPLQMVSAAALRLFAAAVVSAAALGAVASAQPQTAPRAKQAAPSSWAAYAARPNQGAVWVVKLRGTIDLGLAALVERASARAEADDLLVLDIRTLGGRLDAAIRIRDALLDTAAPTVAWVNQRAISAGALIALASDTLLMTPGASIGAATPVQQGADGKMEATSEKVVSYMRAEMRATAEAKGRPPALAEAMVDADVAVEGLSAKGKLLTLTTPQAIDSGLAQGQAVSLAALLQDLRRGEAPRRSLEADWGERLARWLTDPTVSSLLMSLGFLALVMELYTPGLGFSGLLGLLSLGLFFFGQHAAHLAGWEALLLLVLGLVLVAVEVLVIPGFGLAGIAGMAAIGGALVLSMLDLNLPLGVSSELGYLEEALKAALGRFAVSSLFIALGLWALFRWAPRASSRSWLVFSARGRGPSDAPLGAEAPGSSLPQSYGWLQDARGTAQTPLRPAGIVAFERGDGGEQRVHCITEGQYVDAGAQVQVVEVAAHRVVVRSV